jgi:phosphate transport system substrate-binding protein
MEWDSTRYISLAPDYDGCTTLVEEINWSPSGTHDSYMNLIARDVEIVLVARAPSEEELQAASNAGVALDVRPIALDAFVFLVHVDNPVESLRLDAVRRIYSGEITDWRAATGQQVMGFGIHAYQRNDQSGSQELMERLVMQGTEMADFPDMILYTMSGPLNSIGGNGYTAGDSLGIGYSVYFYANYIFPHEQVKLIGINGVLPTSSTIASGAYPLTTEVYVVIREDTPADDSAVLLRDWLLTEQGQAVVEESGYVPVAP